MTRHGELTIHDEQWETIWPSNDFLNKITWRLLFRLVFSRAVISNPIVVFNYNTLMCSLYSCTGGGMKGREWREHVRGERERNRGERGTGRETNTEERGDRGEER